MGLIRAFSIDFERFFNSSFQFMGILTTDGVLRYANQTALDFIGATQEAVSGKLFWDTPWWNHDPKLMEALQNSIAKSVETLEIQSLTVVHKSAEGAVHHFHFTLKPIIDADGQLTHLMAEGKDITELHNARLNNEYAVRKYKDLFENSADAQLIIQGNRFVEANKMALVALGIDTSDTLRGMHPSKISPAYQPDGRASMEKADAMIDLAYENGSHRFDWVHQKTDGTTFDVEVVLTPIRSGEETLLFVIWRDISDRLKAQRDLEHLNTHLETVVESRTKELVEAQHDLLEAQRDLLEVQKQGALSHLLVGLSHEMNTPIGNALTAASYLNDLTGASNAMAFEDIQDLARLILRNLEVAVDLIENFKEHAIELVDEVPEHVDVQTLVADTVHQFLELDAFKGLSTNPQFSLRVDACEGIRVISYPNVLKQVLLEILRNACQHGLISLLDERAKVGTGSEPQRSAEIRVRCFEEKTADGPVITIQVQDNGSGMPQEVLNHIFEPFYTTTRTQRSAGLGLSLAYSQVRHVLKGKIRVECPAEGGTRFSVTFGNLI